MGESPKQTYFSYVEVGDVDISETYGGFAFALSTRSSPRPTKHRFSVVKLNSTPRTAKHRLGILNSGSTPFDLPRLLTRLAPTFQQPERKPILAFSLLLTCRHIYLPAVRFLYQNIVFHPLRQGNGPGALSTFHSMIPIAQSSSIRTLYLELPIPIRCDGSPAKIEEILVHKQ